MYLTKKQECSKNSLAEADRGQGSSLEERMGETWAGWHNFHGIKLLQEFTGLQVHGVASCSVVGKRG